MNQLTHWLDASNIYGSDDHEANLLRSNMGGKLKVSNIDGLNMLPKCHKFSELYDEDNGLEACHQPCGDTCFAGG